MEPGAAGDAVAKNVTRIRGTRGLNYSALSKLLGQHGREIPPLAVRRIEEGERRVDVDDLVALSVALNVSPATLLMPNSDEEAADTSLTGTGTLKANDMWDWLTANNPLPDGESPISPTDQWVVFIHDAWPTWRVRQAYGKSFEEMQNAARRGPRGDDK